MHSTDYLTALFSLEARALSLARAAGSASPSRKHCPRGSARNPRRSKQPERTRRQAARRRYAVSQVIRRYRHGFGQRGGQDNRSNVGPIDILVNNAGISAGAAENFTDADWDELMATNLDGVFKVSRAAVKGMIERRRGVIINVSSVQSALARPSIAPYAASKGAITMLTKSMAGEWGQHNVRVNAIAPGYFKTELNAALVGDHKFSEWLKGRTPMRRWGEVHELAGAVLFLASDAASFVTGQTLLADGGITSVL